MTELSQKFEKQHKQEEWDNMFKDIMNYKESCEHNLLPSTFKKTLKFIFKEREVLKVKHVEVYWWTYKPSFSKSINIIHYILIGWPDGKVTKLYCFNSTLLDNFQLTDDLRKFILNHGGSLHKLEEDK